MGLIRWLLAIAVVAAHSEQIFQLKFLNASEAVRTFFMISGFYMALILNKKYLKLENGYRLFITNRFLRLYPIYWIVLLSTIAVCTIGYLLFDKPFLLEPFITQHHHLNPLAWILVIVSNLIIFLQSTLSFVNFYQQHIFVVNTNPVAIPGWYFLLVPQAWSIGLELSFYLVAPFFVGRSLRNILLLALACVVILLVIYVAGLAVGPWGQRFFISGFVHFVCGTITYKLYETFLKKHYTRSLAVVLLVAWVATTVYSNALPNPYGLRYWVYLVQSFISIPFVFELTKNMKWDRFIGEFSYPVYLSHYVVIGIVSFASSHYGLEKSWTGEIAVIVTMLVSFILLRFVTIPIDRIRENRVLRSRDKSSLNQIDSGNNALP